MRDDQAEELISHVKEIKLILEGNTKLGIEGLVKTVSRHEKWIGKMDLRLAAWSGAGATLALIGRWAIFGH